MHGVNKKNPRVLFVSDRYFPNNHGGAERIAQLEASGWTLRGGQAAIFATYGSGADSAWGVQDADGVSAYRSVRLREAVERTRSGRAISVPRSVMNPIAARELRRAVEAYRPDIIHAHHVSTLSYGAVALQPGPKVLTLHDYHYECARGGLYHPKRGLCKTQCLPCRGYASVLAPTLRGFDSIIAISSFIQRRLEGAGYQNVSYLPNAIPGNKSPEPLRSRAAGSLRVLAIGRLEPNKALHDFAERFADVSPDGWTLTIAGAGSLEDRVAEIAGHSDRVRFVGSASGAEVNRLMGDHDVVVVPSRWHEVLNTVIKESQSAGRPVVATDVGGNGDLVQDGSNGFLIELTPESDVDWSQLFKRLSDIADDIPLVERMSACALESAKNASLNEHFAGLERIYESVLPDISGRS